MGRAHSGSSQNNAIREYLYIDKRRLDSYLEQLSSTKTKSHSSSLEGSLSLTDVSVSCRRVVELRDKTDHEKITELIEGLDRTGQLGYRRPSLVCGEREDVDLPDFVLETCDAVRIGVPASETSRFEEGAVIWLSEWPLIRGTKVIRPPGVLCIIQDLTSDDRRYRAGFSFSGYTWVVALLKQLRQQPCDTRLLQEYEFGSTNDYSFDLMSAQQLLQKDMCSVRRDPVKWLEAKGCKILSLERRVSALYRIRNLGIDEIDTQNREEDFTVSTFAYGIAIWA